MSGKQNTIITIQVLMSLLMLRITIELRNCGWKPVDEIGGGALLLAPHDRSVKPVGKPCRTARISF